MEGFEEALLLALKQEKVPGTGMVLWKQVRTWILPEGPWRERGSAGRWLSVQ